MASQIKLKRSTVAGTIPSTPGDLASGELGINLADQILYGADGVVVFEIGANLTFQTLTSNSDNSLANTILTLHKNSITSANNDYLAQMVFRGQANDDTSVDYASITSQIIDDTQGEEDGSLVFKTRTGGTLADVIVIDADGTLRSANAGYENLITSDDDFVTKKYGDDNWASAGNPAGSVREIQYHNDGGSFGASSNFTWQDSNTILTIVSTDAGATPNPTIILDRDSASAAQDDDLGQIVFKGNDSGSADNDYAAIKGKIVTQSAGSERGSLIFQTSDGGTLTDQFQLYRTISLGIPVASIGDDLPATPDSALHVHEGSAGTLGAAPGYTTIVAENSGAAGISIHFPDSSQGGIRFAKPGDIDAGTIRYVGSSNTMIFETGSAGGRLEFLPGLGFNLNHVIDFKDDTLETVVITENNDTADVGPTLILDRHSASAAAADILGKIVFRGETASAGGNTDYAAIYTVIDDPAAAAEDGRIVFQTGIGGVLSDTIQIEADGTLSSTNTAYENLITSDDDFITKKYFDDNQAGGGNVSNSGTPVDNQIAIWVTATSIEGHSGFTYNSAANPTLSLISTDAGAGAGPTLIFDRNSASASNADVLGEIVFRGETASGGGNHDYAAIHTVIDDSTAAGEDGRIEFLVSTGGAALASAIQIESDGTLSSTNTAYEALVTADDDIPNKKYVDDAILNADKLVSVQLSDGSGAITTGDGKAYIRISSELNNHELVSAHAAVTAPSTSGTIDVQVARGRQSGPTSAHAFVDMLSTAITIDANEYDSKDAATSESVNTSNDDVEEGDLIRIDVDSVGSGPTAVLIVTLEFKVP